jgi:hypothetical protein
VEASGTSLMTEIAATVDTLNEPALSSTTATKTLAATVDAVEASAFPRATEPQTPTTVNFVNDAAPPSTTATEISKSIVDAIEASVHSSAAGTEAPKMMDAAKIHESSSAISPFPDVWTNEQWVCKKKEYPWLGSRNGKLGCLECESRYSCTGPSNLGSLEWQTFSVSFYGADKKAKLKSLRKKILRHKDSANHINAIKTKERSKKAILEKHVDQINKEEIQTTEKVLRTAYFLAKNDRPFTDHPDLLELQELNGANVGIGLRSRFSATNLVNHISTEMRKTLCTQIQTVGGKVAVLIDETTTLSTKSALIVYLKCQSTEHGVPHFVFLDLVELENQTATAICASLLHCLELHGFSDSYLKDNFVGFVSDGASVMLGKKSGVARLILNKYPNIIVWHCLNHRLELAVSDAINEVAGVNHFQMFFDKLYSLYSRSPKNQHELDGCALELSQQLRKIGRVFDVRWVASTFRTVSAVWNNFLSLCLHFEKCSTDARRSSQDRSMFQGLLSRIKSSEFLINLGVMSDVLRELSNLSLLLQDRSASLVYADKLIRRTIRSLEILKENSGEKTLEARAAEENMKFHNVDLAENKKVAKINEKQFLTSIINNMRARMFTTQSSNEKQRSEMSNVCYRDEYYRLLAEFSVLDEALWPADLSYNFGESEIKSLCSRFGFPEAVMVNAFRDYIDNLGQKVPSDLLPLLHCTQVLPCSTAECERGFSHMNIILSDTRTKLLVTNVSSLLFIKLHGPPLRSWNPSKYSSTWLRKHRTASDTKTRTVSNRQQEKADPVWQFL